MPTLFPDFWTGFPIQCLPSPVSFYLWTGFPMHCLSAPVSFFLWTGFPIPSLPVPFSFYLWTDFPIQCLLAPFSFDLWTGFLIQCLLPPGFFNLLNVIKSHCPPIHCNLHQQHLINSQSIKTPTHIYIYIFLISDHQIWQSWQFYLTIL